MSGVRLRFHKARTAPAPPARAAAIVVAARVAAPDHQHKRSERCAALLLPHRPRRSDRCLRNPGRLGIHRPPVWSRSRARREAVETAMAPQGAYPVRPAPLSLKLPPERFARCGCADRGVPLPRWPIKPGLVVMSRRINCVMEWGARRSIARADRAHISRRAANAPAQSASGATTSRLPRSSETPRSSPPAGRLASQSRVGAAAYASPRADPPCARRAAAVGCAARTANDRRRGRRAGEPSHTHRAAVPRSRSR
jgi:hypothetical protein